MAEPSDTAAEPGREALVTALTTEHFALQAISASTVSEAGSRASLYMLTVSSSLVALGFVGLDAPGFVSFAAVVASVVFLLGVFTELRLVGTSAQNLSALRRIALIHGFYAGLHPEAVRFFGTGDDEASSAGVLSTMAVQEGRRAGLFTMAAMIAAVNSVVAGAGTACVVSVLLGRGPGGVPGVLVSVVAGAVHAVAFFVHQDRTLRRVWV